MALKIEKTPAASSFGVGTRNGALREFVLALKVMQVGECVVLPKNVGSNFRQSISVAQMLLDVEFATRTEGKNIRVARIT